MRRQRGGVRGKGGKPLLFLQANSRPTPAAARPPAGRHSPWGEGRRVYFWEGKRFPKFEEKLVHVDVDVESVST